MPVERHVTDPLVDELAFLYERGAMRIDALVTAGLRRGLDPRRANTESARAGDATQAYRERQRVQVAAILDDLTKAGRQAGPMIVQRAYRAGGLAVDRTLGPGAAAAGQFGGVHARAVEALAGNLTRSLEAATQRVGQNVATVFERANALDGGIPTAGIGGIGFIGRRAEDAWRDHALEAVGQGLIAQDTRRAVSAHLRDRLIREGTTDALTGFVTRTGARIPLDKYVSMVARTTTREAVSRGTVNRLDEGGRDLVTISSHPHKADVCTPYDGQTFSLHGRTPGYEVLDVLPPFHPNCLHVLTPAGVDLDAWEAELADVLKPDPVRRRPGAFPAPSAPPDASPNVPGFNWVDPAQNVGADWTAAGRYFPKSTPQHDAYSRAILAAKENDPAAIRELAQAIADAAPSGADMVLAVPSKHQGMAKVRGLVADKLGVRDGAKTVDLTLEVDHGVYRGKTAAERAASVGRAVVNGDVRGLNIVLIDDVVVSGSQAGAVRTALLEAGARDVRFVAAARAPAIDAARAARRLPPRPPAGAATAREAAGLPDRLTGGLVGHPIPRTTPATPARLEAQRIADLIANDPGPDSEWWASLEAADRQAAKAAARDRRKANAALNEALGPDLAKFIDRAWGKRERVRERLLTGELTVDDATNMAIDEWDAQDKRAEEAAIRKSIRERRAGSARARCPSCGRFKPRPSAVCQVCGDDPVPLGSDPNEFDREYGYYAADAKQRLASGYEADPFGGG